jgi:hypothetical protein
MKKLTLLGLAAAALLGGCASYQNLSFLRLAEKPQITLKNGPGSFMVEPATLSFGLDQRDVTIVWRLPEPTPQSPKLRFAPRTGIVIDGEIVATVVTVPAQRGDAMRETPSRIVIDAKQKEIIDCHEVEGSGGQQFSCRNLHTKAGIYKYTITLTDGEKDYILDPEIANW